MSPHKCRKFWKEHLLTFLIISCVLLGIIVGSTIRLFTTVPSYQARYIFFTGAVVIRMLKCIAVPLIVTCIVCSIGSLSIGFTKTICWQIIVLMFCTKVGSVIISLILVSAFNPGGIGKRKETNSSVLEASTVQDLFLDIGRNLVPNNIISTFVKQYSTLLTPPEESTRDYAAWYVQERHLYTFNILGTMSLSIVLGVGLALLGETGKEILLLASSVYAVAMEISGWVLWTAGPFLFFLVLAEIIVIENFEVYFTTWGLFIITDVLACFCVSLIFQPLLLFLGGRTNPFKFYFGMSGSYITAFGTASSVGTLPLLIKELEQLGTEPRLVRCLTPVFININKDGAAVYLSVAIFFILQITDTSVTPATFSAIVILSAMGSIAVAAVPFSGPVTLLIILGALGLDQSYIGTFLALDWITDRASVFTNIVANSVIVKVIETWSLDLVSKMRTQRD